MLDHYMIDLETMGTRSNAAIVSIGIVQFNQDKMLREFYTPVYLQSCIDAGLTTEPSTVNWWGKQSPEARAAWQVQGAPTLTEALTKLVHWMRESKGEPAPWGNGSDFDNCIMASAFAAIDADAPWKHYHTHCFRTMKNIFKIGVMPREGVHHNALDDAKHQVAHLHRILEIHKIKLS